MKSSLDFQKPDGALTQEPPGVRRLISILGTPRIEIDHFGKAIKLCGVVKIDSETIDQVAKIPIIVIIEGSYVRHNFPWRFLPA